MLVESDKIVPSASTYRTPILFVAKKGRAGLLMYIDYHSMNFNAITDSFLLPRIIDLLVHLSGSKVFSNFDLLNGYQ